MSITNAETVEMHGLFKLLHTHEMPDDARVRLVTLVAKQANRLDFFHGRPILRCQPPAGECGAIIHASNAALLYDSTLTPKGMQIVNAHAVCRHCAAKHSRVLTHD